jgi:ribonuclease D
MVGYASEDVMFLCLVYKQMHGFLNAHNRKIAFEYSAKYVVRPPPPTTHHASCVLRVTRD